jgi:hypothetical protein|tara:strand:- start:55 stop:306 length:252 start_codon:yes stop_codon:yes gene_type:complete
MATFISKPGLKPNVITKNGTETIEFIATTVTYQQSLVQFAVEYFNPVTGLFDTSKTVLVFGEMSNLVIDEEYSVISLELLNLV